MNFSFDGLAARQYIVTILEKKSKIPIPIPIPNLDILKATLARKAPAPLKSEVLGEMSNKEPTEALSLVLGALVKSADAVSVSGQLDVVRYGHVLKARQKVGGPRRRRLLRRPLQREGRHPQRSSAANTSRASR